jgi:hypothetical protein
MIKKAKQLLKKPNSINNIDNNIVNNKIPIYKDLNTLISNVFYESL